MAKRVDAATAKLAAKLGDADLAAALVGAGFDNPRKIRDASNKQLKAVSGVGPSAVSKIRTKFGKAK